MLHQAMNADLFSSALIEVPANIPHSNPCLPIGLSNRQSLPGPASQFVSTNRRGDEAQTPARGILTVVPWKAGGVLTDGTGSDLLPRSVSVGVLFTDAPPAFISCHEHEAPFTALSLN